MKPYLPVIKELELFRGINDNMDSILGCLDPRQRSYDKNSTIFSIGDKVDWIGIVLSGRIQLLREDVNGYQDIVAQFGKGEIFGEAYACAGVDHTFVSAVATAQSEILFINIKKIITVCGDACTFHNKLIENLLGIVARKNIVLNQKIEVITKRTIREKITAYLENQRLMCSSEDITIPFNRSELADYLCADRSALSRELSRMRDEGILEFEKNRFRLK